MFTHICMCFMYVYIVLHMHFILFTYNFVGMLYIYFGYIKHIRTCMNTHTMLKYFAKNTHAQWYLHLVFKFLWKKIFIGYYSLRNTSSLTVGQCSVLSIVLFLNVFITERQLQLLRLVSVFKVYFCNMSVSFSKLNLALRNDG